MSIMIETLALSTVVGNPERLPPSRSQLSGNSIIIYITIAIIIINHYYNKKS